MSNFAIMKKSSIHFNKFDEQIIDSTTINYQKLTINQVNMK